MSEAYTVYLRSGEKVLLMQRSDEVSDFPGAWDGIHGIGDPNDHDSVVARNSKVGPIEEMAQSWQDEIEGRVKGLQTGSYARILKMAKKPSKQEFRQTVIVCGIGMFVLGAIGFVILALMVNVFPPFFQWLIG